MQRIVFFALVLLPVFLSIPAARGDEEICAAGEKKVLMSGDFSHSRAWGVTTIVGATWRGEEAFREEIFGTNFTLTVSDLPAARYTAVIGFAEVDFTNAGQRVFDITSADKTLVANLDIFTAAAAREKCITPATWLT